MPTYNYMEENGLPYAKVFGDRVRARRKELGLSQGDLYEKTGVSTAYISAVERGTANPSLDIMVQLSAALEIEVAELLRTGPSR
jgi:transcriptional regulator with XRE-family HTH domain